MAKLSDTQAERLYDTNKDKALSVFNDVLEKDENNITAHFYLALIYLERGQLDRALFHAQQAELLNPKEPNLHLNLGCIYHQMGKVDLEIKHYKKELALNPDPAEALFNLGQTYFERHRWKTAIKYFEKCLALKHRVDDFVDDLAICYNKTKQIDKEIDLYQKYLKDVPDSDWAMQNLGAALIDVGRYREALNYLKKAKAVDPNDLSIDRNIQKALEGIQEAKRSK